MKTTSLLCAMAVAAAFAGPANAIYKCTTAKGVVYQDRPCREGNETDVQIVIPTGEVAPRSTARRTAMRAANAPRDENAVRRGQARTHLGRRPGFRAKPADRKSGDAASNGADGSRRKEARTSRGERGRPADRRPGPQDRSDRQVLRHRGVRDRQRNAHPDELRVAHRREAGLLPQQRQADVDLIRCHRRRRPGACRTGDAGTQIALPARSARVRVSIALPRDRQYGSASDGPCDALAGASRQETNRRRQDPAGGSAATTRRRRTHGRATEDRRPSYSHLAARPLRPAFRERRVRG